MRQIRLYRIASKTIFSITIVLIIMFYVKKLYNPGVDWFYDIIHTSGIIILNVIYMRLRFKHAHLITNRIINRFINPRAA